MALVNPNIAMSFRQPEFKPRNAMAEYAQMQQIQGGQRQAEIADMQLEELRRDRDTLGQIQAAIVAKGGPADLGAAADAMLKSGNPKYLAQGLAIRETLEKQRLLSQYESQYGGGGAPAMPSSAPNAMVAPAAPSMRSEIIDDRDGKPVEIEVNRGIAPPGAMGQPLAPLGAAAPVAPATPAPVNAMAPASAMPDVNALRKQYGMAVAAGRADAPVLLEQIKAALKPDPAPSELRTMQQLGYPMTQEGYLAFRAAQMKDSAPPVSIAEFERAKRDPDFMRFLQERAAASRQAAPVTNITNVQEKAEAGEFGKLLVGQFDAISKQASVAARTLPSIDANLALLNKGLATGFGTEAKAAGAKVLGALGVQNAEKYATDTQTFQANAIGAVLQKQLEQKGVQTDQDAKRIEQIGAQLGKTKEANEFILSVAREQLKRDIEQRNFYTNWKSGPGKGSFDGAENAWFSGEGNKSLFDRPALKKYGVTSPAAPAASQIPTGATPARAAPSAISQDAVNFLRANPNLKAQFDAKYGAGAGDRVLKGQ